MPNPPTHTHSMPPFAHAPTVQILHILIHNVSLLSEPLLHITVQGMIQHWQSSPHQQGSLTGGFEMGPFATVVVEEEPEDVAEVVEGGIV